MNRARKILNQARQSTANVHFTYLVRLVEAVGYVERRRGGGGSHRIFRHSGRAEPPLINLQSSRGRAKSYQVLNVIDEFGLELP